MAEYPVLKDKNKKPKDICKECLKADYNDNGELICLAAKCVHGKRRTK